MIFLSLLFSLQVGAIACDPNAISEKLFVTIWDGTKIPLRWVDHAPQGCPGVAFPLLHLQEPKAKAYVQVIEIDIPHPTDQNTNVWGMQLDRRKNWVFLDVSNESRENKIPFYNGSNFSPTFFDNPKWGHIADESPILARKWKANLYALSVDAKNKCSSLWGIEWGFKQVKGSLIPEPIRPKGLSRGQWNRDRKLIQNLRPVSCSF